MTLSYTGAGRYADSIPAAALLGSLDVGTGHSVTFVTFGQLA